MFDDLLEFFSELSRAGIVFALLVVGFIFALQDYMLKPFLVHMGTATAIFWGAATYLVSAIVGYLAGVKMFDE